MRATGIRVTGFKRLADMTCNVDGRLIAFVGRNEAGKTSLLELLDWFTDPDADEIAGTSMTHGMKLAGRDPVVSVKYYLDEDDRKALGDLEVREVPRWFEVERSRDCRYAASVVPEPRRNPEPFDVARKALEASRRTRPKQYAEEIKIEDDEGDLLTERPADWLSTLDAALATPDQVWSVDIHSAFDRLLKWLQAETAPGKHRDVKTAEALSRVGRVVRAEHPESVIRARLLERLPRFVLFKERDRRLPSESEIQRPQHRAALAGGVQNLASLAGLDLDALASDIAQDHDRGYNTALKHANRRLQRVFSETWNQYGITVKFGNQGTVLKVMIDPDDDYSDVTPIHERSDGLKTFVALVALLASQSHDIPPILLIDEAETHLHFDAQADLIEVMSTFASVEQVFYSTHSPGCLPNDLGRGIRIIKPDPRNESRSVADSVYWDDDTPGFSPLLVKMGAAGAAFSACRQAVVAEGAADMVLLPTLIRLATDTKTLDYQVAPGLASADILAADFDAVAAKVVFLADGDAEGARYLDTLRERRGVPDPQVLAHPKGMAIEDYVHPDRYLEVVNLFLKSPDKPMTTQDLRRGQPVARSVAEWCKARRLKEPGKRAVGTYLVEHPDQLQLADGAREALIALHGRISEGFATRVGTRA